MQAMAEHTKPERSVLVARSEFVNLVRLAEENVRDYVARLKHVASDCKFPDCKFPDCSCLERLRDRFVCGIRNDRMARKLLAENTHSYHLTKPLRFVLAWSMPPKWPRH